MSYQEKTTRLWWCRSFSIPLCVISYIYIYNCATKMRVLRIQTQQFIVSSLLGMIECKWSASPKRFGGSTTPINAQQMQLSPAFRQSTAYKEGCIAHENACSNKLQVSYNHTRGTFVSSLLHLHLSLFTSKKMKKMYSPLLWLFCRYETNNTIYH